MDTLTQPNKIRSEVLNLSTDSRKWKAQREYNGISKDNFEESMKIKYNYLYSKSTTLFDRCIIGDINMDQFNYMINMLEKVNSGQNYQQASQEVGQKLVDIYVKPLIE